MTNNTDPFKIDAGGEVKSNLPPDLQALVRSADFKEWFGDWENDPANASKIIDKNGEPALMYFGGPPGISRLHGDSRRRTAPNEKGFYFTRVHSTARGYAELMYDDEDRPVPSSVYSAFLNIRNPYYKRPGDGISTSGIDEIPAGYDGFVHGALETVAFSPDQVTFVKEEPVNPGPPNVPLSSTVSFEK